ncbi:hypothetical protein FACS189421_00370 [Bacteroidia bacterium]|nr:hypothetical protein FACS189421_00370 [Bacteroidia bacterium]GHT47486.1 hypothetical protein FACS189440_08140 [Bacteroidia bacterium]
MKKYIYIILTGIFFLTLWACENSNDIVSEEQQPEIVGELFEQNEYNLDLKNFALAVSHAVKTNEQFRKLIKQEALVKFDGDYDVLLSHIMNKPLVQSAESAQLRSSDNYTVKDLLEESYVSTESSSNGALRASSSSIISTLSAQYPNLQVSVPVHAEDWDENTVTPVVTFIPSEFQDGVTQSVTGYKSDGSLTVVDAINPPGETVIVVSENERIYTWEPGVPYRPGTPYYPIEPSIAEALPDTEVPPTPTNLTASQTSAGVALNWSETTESMFCHTIGYYIYRKSPSDADYILRAVNNGLYNTIYYDQTTEAGLSYSYYVTAYNSLGESTRSNVVSVVGTGRPASLSSFEAMQNTSNEVELRWATDNNQYIQKIQLYKHTVGTTTDYQLYQEFGANDYHYFDNNVIAGKTMKYKMQIVTPTGSSNPKYDFVQVPYRDPSKKSAVRIKHMHCRGNIESPLRGAPEFYIKVLGVDKDKKTTELQSSIFVNFKGSSLGWNHSQDFNILVLEWKPDSWYDKLTFFAMEDDENKNWELSLSAKLNYKLELAKGLGLDAGLEGKYTFGHKGDEVGYAYLDYFDPIDKVLEFPNYDVRITIGQ